MVLYSPDEQARVRTEIAKGNWFRPLPPNFTALVGITDPRMAEWVQERLTPHPISTYEDPPPSGSAESALTPRAFIHCTDRATAPFLEVFISRARSLGWKMHDLSAGHAAMLTHPESWQIFCLDWLTISSRARHVSKSQQSHFIGVRIPSSTPYSLI